MLMLLFCFDGNRKHDAYVLKVQGKWTWTLQGRLRGAKTSESSALIFGLWGDIIITTSH